ncbi:MAG: peptidase [Nitrosopumilus sp.]|nr:peptidase [Nitrosopumilus sp.]
MTTPVFAHSTKIVGDFKIETGWRDEPPIEGIPNAVEITISLAEENDKMVYDMVFFNRLNDSDEKPTEKDLSGLENKIETYVSLKGKKTSLVLNENENNQGVYYAELTPEEGNYTLHLYGILKNLEFETTGQIETVTSNEDENKKQIPDWIRNNAKWYAEGSIEESDFTSGIEFMIKNGIMKIPNMPEYESSQDSPTVPDWIKNNAKWWSEGSILDEEFIKGIQFLVTKGIIKI